MSSWWMTTVFAALTLAIVAAPAAMAVQDVKEVLPLDSDGRFSISMIAGTITVQGWDSDQVEITGTLDDEAELKVSTSPGAVTVRVEYPKSERIRNRGRGRECNLVVRVPGTATVEVEGVSANIVIRDVQGRVHAEAVSGGIDISGRPVAVDATTVSGSVVVEGAEKSIRANSVSGSVEVSADGGELYLESVSGRIRIRGGTLDRVEAGSVSGNVEFEGRLGRNVRMDLNSHSGSVDVRLLGEVSARLSLETFSGSIESEFGGEADRESRFTPKKSLEYTVGSGEGRVNINTFSGSIRLMK